MWNNFSSKETQAYKLGCGHRGPCKPQRALRFDAVCSKPRQGTFSQINLTTSAEAQFYKKKSTWFKWLILSWGVSRRKSAASASWADTPYPSYRENFIAKQGESLPSKLKTVEQKFSFVNEAGIQEHQLVGQFVPFVLVCFNVCE